MVCAILNLFLRRVKSRNQSSLQMQWGDKHKCHCGKSRNKSDQIIKDEVRNAFDGRSEEGQLQQEVMSKVRVNESEEITAKRFHWQRSVLACLLNKCSKRWVKTQNTESVLKGARSVQMSVTLPFAILSQSLPSF